MILKKRKLNVYIFVILIILSRLYFYQIDECFSDFCRHSKELAINNISNSIEFLPFLIYENYPFALYTFDLPFLILALSSKAMTYLNRIILCIWALQPSYDILFLIFLTILFSYYRIKILSFVTLLWVKFEVTILITTSLISYWRPTSRFKFIGELQFIIAFCFSLLIFATIIDISIVSGPENGKFQGVRNMIFRFFGYLAMPISSLLSYQFNISFLSNLIRIQSILLAFIFFAKCKKKDFLANYILACAIIAVIVNFYQLRYVLTFITAFSLYKSMLYQKDLNKH